MFNNKLFRMNHRRGNPAKRDNSYGALPVFSNLRVISAAARFMRPAMREKSDPDEKHRDPRFDHNLIEKHQVCRIGT
jgi:hypothetical protein